mgnify:CR=1 FL=1
MQLGNRSNDTFNCVRFHSHVMFCIIYDKTNVGFYSPDVLR